jgi:hypothetical protein
MSQNEALLGTATTNAVAFSTPGQQNATTRTSPTTANGMEEEAGRSQNPNEAQPTWADSEPNHDVDWNMLLGYGSQCSELDLSDFDYDPAVDFQ